MDMEATTVSMVTTDMQGGIMEVRNSLIHQNSIQHQIHLDINLSNRVKLYSRI